MEDIALKNIWKAQEEKLDRSLQLNMYLLESLQKDKARSKLSKLAKFKTVVLVLGIVWCAFLGLLIYGNQLQNIYFTVSVGMILLFNLFACTAYIRQIIQLQKLDHSKSIVATQKELASLQTSTINITRILMLQAPFYTTWFYTAAAVKDTLFQLISFSVTLLFVFVSIWLYKNIRLENMGKKWLRSFMNAGPEYRSITEARDFLSEIEKFKTA